MNAQFRSERLQPPAGGDPETAALDKRVTVLETQWQTVIPTLALREDLQSLRVEMQAQRVEMHQGFGTLRGEMAQFRNDVLQMQLKTQHWLIGTLISLGSLLVALMGLLLTQMSGRG